MTRRERSHSLAWAAASACAACAPCFAAELLNPDMVVERELAAGASDRFVVMIDAAGFAAVEVVERGADVLLTTTDPEGRSFEDWTPHAGGPTDPVHLVWARRGKEGQDG